MEYKVLKNVESREKEQTLKMFNESIELFNKSNSILKGKTINEYLETSKEELVKKFKNNDFYKYLPVADQILFIDNALLKEEDYLFIKENQNNIPTELPVLIEVDYSDNENFKSVKNIAESIYKLSLKGVNINNLVDHIVRSINRHNAYESTRVTPFVYTEQELLGNTMSRVDIKLESTI